MQHRKRWMACLLLSSLLVARGGFALAIQAEPELEIATETNGSPAALPPGYLDPAQVNLQGIGLAMTEADVRRVLGEPTEVFTDDRPSACFGAFQTLVYDDFSVTWIKGQQGHPDVIRSIAILPNDPTTTLGSLEEILATYGPPHDDLVIENSRRLTYRVGDEEGWLWFGLPTGDDVFTARYDSALPLTALPWVDARRPVCAREMLLDRVNKAISPVIWGAMSIVSWLNQFLGFGS